MQSGDGSRLETVSSRIVRKWLRMDLNIMFSRCPARPSESVRPAHLSRSGLSESICV